MTASVTEPTGTDLEPPRQLDSNRTVDRRLVVTVQLAVVVVFLLAWEYLPKIPGISDYIGFLNPFYISSPSETLEWIVRLATGDEVTPVWSYLQTTLWASVAGTLIGVVTGALFGLVLSDSAVLAAIFRPFLILVNTLPRIALLPIIILIVGPDATSSVINATLIVFFLVFFNAFEGGRSVRTSMIESSRLLGASRANILLYVRAPKVAAWTFAVIPNSLSFALIVVVANELLTGVQGMGALLYTATLNLQAGLTFAVIFYLAVAGLLLNFLASLVQRALVDRLGGEKALHG